MGLDVGVAGRGAGLDECVVDRDGGGRAVAPGGGEEQQPEVVADGQAGGLETPVRWDIGDGVDRAVDSDCESQVGMCNIWGQRITRSGFVWSAMDQPGAGVGSSWMDTTDHVAAQLHSATTQ